MYSTQSVRWNSAKDKSMCNACFLPNFYILFYFSFHYDYEKTSTKTFIYVTKYIFIITKSCGSIMSIANLMDTTQVITDVRAVAVKWKFLFKICISNYKYEALNEWKCSINLKYDFTRQHENFYFKRPSQ